MKATTARIDMLVWALIYAGLLLASLAFGPARAGRAWGWIVLAAGAAAVLAGGVLIWLRSRMHGSA